MHIFNSISLRKFPGAVLFIVLIFSLFLFGCASDSSNSEQGQIEPTNQSQVPSQPTEEPPKPTTEGLDPNENQAEEVNLNFSGELKVHFLDVGQADSILVQLPNGQTMLIDAGNNSDADFIVSYIKKAGIKKIDYLVGTHPHEDHIGGLDAVIKDFEIGKVIMPNKTHTTATFKDVLTAIQNKGLKITKAEAGKVILDENGLSIAILAPSGSSYEDLNNYSVVIRVTFGKTSFLFTGDAEDISESEMLARSISLKADILKVGHHGSNSSTSKAFLKAVDPTYAVISVGTDNDYGHPTPETINKLKDAGVETYRTDKDGTLIFTSDGKTISISKSDLWHSDKGAVSSTGSATVVPSAPIKSETEYVGSINSDKFHYPNCSGAKKIKPANLVTFKSKADAEAQGYVPCKICKP